MNEIEIDRVLELLTQQVNMLERKNEDFEKESMILIQANQSLISLIQLLQQRVSAIEKQMLEIILLMGLMPGDDSKVH